MTAVEARALLRSGDLVKGLWDSELGHFAYVAWGHDGRPLTKVLLPGEYVEIRS